MENFFISKKIHLDVIDFQLQQMYSVEVAGKGVCITRMGAGRNYSNNTIQIYFHQL